MSGLALRLPVVLQVMAHILQAVGLTVVHVHVLFDTEEDSTLPY